MAHFSKRTSLGLITTAALLSIYGTACHQDSKGDTIFTPNSVCVGVGCINSGAPSTTITTGPVCVGLSCSDWILTSNASNGLGSSFSSQTKDVDLQRAEVNEETRNDRVGAVAERFQMSFESANRVVELADTVQVLSSQNQGMTTEDREAVTSAALDIANVTQDDLNYAIIQGLKGDQTPTNDLLNKAAANLGMSSGSTLRDQLLPALGVDLRN